MGRSRWGLGGVALAGALAILCAGQAEAAVNYEASNGSDGPCAFPTAGTYTFNTDTGQVAGPSVVPALGVINGARRTVNCTTLTVGPEVILRIVGFHAPDLRATGAVTIDGKIDVAANNAQGGVGATQLPSSNGGGSGSGGAPGGIGGGGGRGGGFSILGFTVGGGGGSGFSGGGGGAGQGAGQSGGNGGGSGGFGGGGNGQRGAAGPSSPGATDGSDGLSGHGGGGGGGSYGTNSPFNFHPGSGGGGGGSGAVAPSSNGGDGGGGGGTVRITSAASITLGAGSEINANGGAGFFGEIGSGTNGGGGGGGSGGSIELISPALTVAPGGALFARGGIGGIGAGNAGDGGNGSPGRVDISTNSPTTSLNDAADPDPTTLAYSFGVTVQRTGDGSGSVTSSPAGIDCGSDCFEEYQPATTVTLTAAAAAGSAFTGWAGACAGTAPCVVSTTENRLVVAVFDAPDPTPAPTPTPTPTPDPTPNPNPTPTAPETTIDSTKIKKEKGKAKFFFSATGGTGAVTFECSLDGKPFAACTSPTGYRNLKDGKHRFEVRALAGGLSDQTPAFAKFKIKRPDPPA